jgi:hypothetical protein
MQTTGRKALSIQGPSARSSTAAVVAMTMALMLAAFVLAPAASAATQRGGLTLPPPPQKTGMAAIVQIARTELSRNVVERRSDNVPRYWNGKGPIAPYSIGDAWCVAFATWVWRQSGFDDYLSTSLLRRSHDRSVVAVQVRDLTKWAVKNRYWSLRAKPGYLVLYGDRHIGIVERVDRDGRAIGSIEGNKTDRVRRVVVDMELVTGYISPRPIPVSQAVPRTSSLADVD